MLLYRLFIRLYILSITVIAPFNKKARLWLLGRKNLLKRMQADILPADKIAWFHCASLGEFEQGRPVLEEIKQRYPAYKILLTFFSPSGYEIRKDYAGADFIYYLPADTASNARSFLDIAKPSIVIFIKYEFWFHYLHEVNKRNIPLLLVSGIFRQDQPFFKWYGSLHKKMLSFFDYILVQNDESKQLLHDINLKENVLITGDTRFDRVIAIAENFEPITEIEAFCQNADVIVAGSTWSADDKELFHFVNAHPAKKFIIAPHDISVERINECKRVYTNSILYSEYVKGRAGTFNILIIDNVGMLSRLYRYGTVCFIGGGFAEEGVHNVLEAAVYGKPVVYGPVYNKYIEAVELIEVGGAFTVSSASEFETVFNPMFQKGSSYQQASKAAYDYVRQKQGATKAILDLIYEKRLLTN
nr:glycosyltransferase N-terminal domain-containing protein [Aridibaculum aurantiacum]